MKILVTGASGLVGSCFARVASHRGHQVVGIIGKHRGNLPGVPHFIRVDLTDEDSLTRTVLETFPEAIVNCAAVSEPAACEADPDRSDSLNVKLPTRLAELSHHLGARLIHISSEQVFDGQKTTPYSHHDPVSPINLYGRQKVASERAVVAAPPHWTAIVRAPLLMGDSPAGRRALHERLFLDWSNGKTARLYTDELRQPCTAENLAEVLLELAERPNLKGVFHWAGAELLSRFDLGVRIRQHFKLSEASAPITATTRAAVGAGSPQRQPCLALDLRPLNGHLKTSAETMDKQLAGLRIPPPCREWYLAQRSSS